MANDPEVGLEVEADPRDLKELLLTNAAFRQGWDTATACAADYIRGQAGLEAEAAEAVKTVRPVQSRHFLYAEGALLSVADELKAGEHGPE